MSDASIRLWSCTDHDTHFPVGGASIVLARTEDEARGLLYALLRLRGLDGEVFSLKEIEIEPGAHVLSDGDY
jgi:hypothetical protein